jgi:hypothetical protein
MTRFLFAELSGRYHLRSLGSAANTRRLLEASVLAAPLGMTKRAEAHLNFDDFPSPRPENGGNLTRCCT